MERASIDALIEHEAAALRAAFPRVERCRSQIEVLGEGLAQRFCVRLDIRAPERQLLISGKAKRQAEAAAYAAFEQARERLSQMPFQKAER